MKTSKKWIEHFEASAKENRVDWNIPPSISPSEKNAVVKSLQAWQLGETSDGSHLIHAATLYADKIKDPDYVKAVKLFIKEEQKHGNNLGLYLDSIKQPRIKKDWGDTLFRKIRYFNTNMEIWTLAVITVESAAQVFYQCLKNATLCSLLRQICTDILIDEAYHIDFQTERMQIIYESKSKVGKISAGFIYSCFFFCTSVVVWMAHKKLFTASGTSFIKYMKCMTLKYQKTLGAVSSVNKRSLSRTVQSTE